MQIGFEFTAAVPKRLRAAEDQPTQQAMQGDRRIRQAPSTDQKRVRREMQRKTAANDTCKHCGYGGEEFAVTSGERDGKPVTPERIKCPSCGMGSTRKTASTAKCPDCDSTEVTRHKDELGAYYKCHGCGSDFGTSEVKTAAHVTAGECRMCGGDLIPLGHKGMTMRAQCTDCGTKHELQGATQKPKNAALAFEAFQNLSEKEQGWLRVVVSWLPPEYKATDCPSCGAGAKHQSYDGHWSSSGHGDSVSGATLKCAKCQATHKVTTEGPYKPTPAKGDYGRTAALRVEDLLPHVGAHWVTVVDTQPYLAQSGMSAIARRAQSVLDQEETP